MTKRRDLKLKNRSAGRGNNSETWISIAAAAAIALLLAHWLAGDEVEDESADPAGTEAPPVSGDPAASH